MRIVLLGPPASGKGTQGRRIADVLDLEYLSTGALLREAVREGDALGLSAKPILDKGGYLPDDLMCSILAQWLDRHDAGNGWLLDGFPRTLSQARFLDDRCKIDHAVALDAPLHELIQRIRKRVECHHCRWSGQTSELTQTGNCPECGGEVGSRADDDEENFRARHAEFTKNTLPVIDFYEAQGKLLRVPATDSRDMTTSLILKHIKSLAASISDAKDSA
jgi:adenylate kinase